MSSANLEQENLQENSTILRSEKFKKEELISCLIMNISNIDNRRDPNRTEFYRTGKSWKYPFKIGTPSHLVISRFKEK